jgi:hypothetical protein
VKAPAGFLPQRVEFLPFAWTSILVTPGASEIAPCCLGCEPIMLE